MISLAVKIAKFVLIPASINNFDDSVIIYKKSVVLYLIVLLPVQA